MTSFTLAFAAVLLSFSAAANMVVMGAAQPDRSNRNGFFPIYRSISILQTGDNETHSKPKLSSSHRNLLDSFPATRDPSIFSGLDPLDIPQFILLTFDDAVGPYTMDLYQPLSSVQDSQGCGIKATWYVSISSSAGGQSLTQCELISGLRKGQHEIATHTYGHNGDPSTEDIIGALDWLESECGVPREEMRGFRTPYLKFSQSTFDRLHDMGFLYDSSIGEPGIGSNKGERHLWPYTMDNGIAQDCRAAAGSCDQNKNLPGMWEIPMWNMLDENDSPMIPMDWPGNAYEHLTHNFERRYNGNRAPLGIYLHASWLYLNGENLKKWAEEVLAAYNDVFFVTNFEMIEWMRNPVSSTQYAITRECEGQVTDCIPPLGGCGHGKFDATQCACACNPPFVRPNCLTVGDSTNSNTPQTSESTNSPATAPSMTLFVAQGSLSSDDVGDMDSGSDYDEGMGSSDLDKKTEPGPGLTTSIHLDENNPDQQLKLAPDSDILQYGYIDVISGSSVMHVSPLALITAAISFALTLVFQT
mmetsp:Transcript_12016/g.25045  ORF Transcript_12016/g.25045 Transcript_12016/m.25045 type:complete len:529 (-) Transcript_12016:193-1779(-)